MQNKSEQKKKLFEMRERVRQRVESHKNLPLTRNSRRPNLVDGSCPKQK